ncbi:hypothetical protein KIH74_31090 [Kineosporia sp. J2-2]|uniref:Uncharacterized protein n=1 Tax=Kineosporia corallincola TaxID=2835133 RepID=A0ABS5TRL3_9ACTN|nr:DUF6081 family protein [Kineosporia corallincola]MBT0773433.1 hypothetical protein [Kineosporia corallincola]
MSTRTTQTDLLFSDDFRQGFPRSGEPGGWHLQPVGDLPQGDARTSVTEEGLLAVSAGTSPMTGLPAFGFTTAQQSQGGEGTRDHVKWTAMPESLSSHGFPGYDTPATGPVTLEATLSVAVHGTDRHPFGPAVSDLHADPRLGCGSLLAADVESFSIFGFFITSTRIYANYERLRLPGTNYAAYTYAVPLADRMPGGTEVLAVTVDAALGQVDWTVNGEKRFTVGHAGRRLTDRSTMLLDHGGEEEDLHPRQIVPGLGMFSLLDGALGDDGTGLVRVDSEPDHYWDPRRGRPEPQRFLDPDGAPGNRLFGQGVEMTVRQVRLVLG